MYKLCKTEESAARQKMIEGGLLQAMLQQRFEDISVSELCKQIGIPRNTFYRYFPEKEDALLALIECHEPDAAEHQAHILFHHHFITQKNSSFYAFHKACFLMIPAKFADRINDLIHLSQGHTVHLLVQLIEVCFNLLVVIGTVLIVAFMEHKLSVLPTYKRGGRKMSNREYRAARKGKSWKFRLMYNIGEAMKTSVNREDFIRQMKRRGYEVWWSEERKYITYTCPNGMKCRCNKLHDDKYLKARLEDEFEKRQQLLERNVLGGADPDERGRDGGSGRGSVPADGLRSAQGMAGELDEAAGDRGAVPAHPLQENHPAGYPEGAAGCGGGSEGRAESGEEGTGGEIKGTEGTGWEPEREYFLYTVRRVLHRSRNDQERVRSTAEEKKPTYVDHDLGLGGAVGAGIRAVSALGRLTEDDDSDDPEEQKRKYKAQQAGSNVGAIIGLTIGAIEAFTHNNQSLARISDEEQQIEEEEEFKEFLARMDEEYGYEEEQQQSM